MGNNLVKLITNEDGDACALCGILLLMLAAHQLPFAVAKFLGKAKARRCSRKGLYVVAE